MVAHAFAACELGECELVCKGLFQCLCKDDQRIGANTSAASIDSTCLLQTQGGGSMQGQQRTTPCPSMLSSWWYTLRYVTSIYVGMLFNVVYYTLTSCFSHDCNPAMCSKRCESIELPTLPSKDMLSIPSSAARPAMEGINTFDHPGFPRLSPRAFRTPLQLCSPFRSGRRIKGLRMYSISMPAPAPDSSASWKARLARKPWGHCVSVTNSTVTFIVV